MSSVKKMSNTRYTMTNNIKNLEYKLLYISKSRYEGDWHSNLHFHHYSEIFYVINGTGSMVVNSISIPLHKDDLIIVNPNILHTEKSTTTDPLDYYVLGIDNLCFDDYVKTGNNSNEYKIFNISAHRSEIITYFEQMLKEVEEKKPFYEIACNNIFTLFLLYVIRYTDANLKVTGATKKVSIEVLNIKKYIDAHYSENLTLEHLSKMTSVNKFYLSHLFKEYVGDSPIQYLNHKRISEAKELLLTTDYTISMIGEIVGFSCESYFSQAFTKAIGISPLKYRKENINK